MFNLYLAGYAILCIEKFAQEKDVSDLERSQIINIYEECTYFHGIYFCSLSGGI